tara:strand:- start:20895 stop:21545 length:651 start_codon:yes stop_codon:yes gene_type:complete
MRRGEDLTSLICISSPSLLKKIMIGCAESVDLLHHSGFIHRDIKLNNFVMTPDGIRLIDFDTLTFDPSDSAAHLLGTPYYFSKEYFIEEIATQASDIWALGVSFLCAIFSGAQATLPYQMIHWLLGSGNIKCFSDMSYLFNLTSIDYRNDVSIGEINDGFHSLCELLESDDIDFLEPTSFQLNAAKLVFDYLLCEPTSRSISRFLELFKLIPLNAE